MLDLEKRKFWDARSELGEQSGSNDFILKRIEIKLLLSLVPAKSHVLDIGCGNGQTLIRLATQNKCTGVGVDFAPNMVNAASRENQKMGLAGKIIFEEGCVPGLRKNLEKFDIVITERCLINLGSLKEQYLAFKDIMQHVKPGGLYLMIEDSFDGLERLNFFREKMDLEAISPPWHNVFFHEKNVAAWVSKEYVLEQFLPFTSTYYFLSRVVYARLAKDKGEELKYDSDINLLALDLPNVGDMGAVRMWIWRRN